jgi:hypothetical protein
MTSTARSFPVNNLPEGGTLVPKHVEVGIYHEMCFIILYFVHFVG